jgi:hypothetical protein
MKFIKELKTKIMAKLLGLNIIYILFVIPPMSGCEFNITDKPGPQVSSTIEVSKKHKAYLCNYRIDGNKINGVLLNEIFVEKKYSLDKGFFSKFHVSDSLAQLVIVSKGDFATQYTGYAIDWQLVGFKSKASSIIYRDIGTNLPDSIPLKVVSIKGKNKNVIQELTLYKEDLN